MAWIRLTGFLLLLLFGWLGGVFVVVVVVVVVFFVFLFFFFGGGGGGIYKLCNSCARVWPVTDRHDIIPQSTIHNGCRCKQLALKLSS